MKSLDILISGASIAGPAVARLLNTQGHRTTVVERAPALRPGGQTVDLRGAGRLVIERMGLTDAVGATLLDQRGIALVDRHGRRRAQMPVEAFGGHGIVSSHEILRGDLARVLYDATRPHTRYVWDDTVTALDTDEDGVTAHFESAPAGRFDLVIGADGLHSAIRRAAFDPATVREEEIGLQTAWFTARIDEPLDGWFLMHNAPGGLVASLRPSRHPGEAKAGLSVREHARLDRRDTDAQWRYFEERFDGAGWLVPQLLEQMRVSPDYAFDSLARVLMPSWTTGRVALVGDAGYCPTPLTGLGTSLALVGAYVLVGELGRADGHIPAAFAAYERVMRPYVTQGQQLPPLGAAGFAPSGRLAIAASRLSYRSMNVWPFQRIWESQFTKAGAIDLPDYSTAGATSNPAT
ncbi:FAD-dependent monooxygenase [Tsukamurella soli]|uniref:FAD-dependent monooxygenase n=1 Tax=Tsukamurella soli TaxID=644556 RepID=A0ABP8K496_9ACTN